MTLDFTLNKYRELCSIITESDYTLLTLEEYFSLKKPPERFIILRHDVDDEPEYALKMAQLETELNAKSTYYFRTTENVFKHDIIRKISSLGHEIGYHYEVLDEACGNYAMAIELFKQNLEKFKDVCEIKTIAQHGSPLMGKLNATSVAGIYEIIKSMVCRNKKIFTNLVNADIWKEYNFRDFGIVGEAYISIDFNDVFYLSDTGMSWNNKYRMKDVVIQGSSEFNNFKVKNTNDIINIIESYKANHIYLLVHADQWRDNLPDWIKWSILKYIRNTGKLGLKWYTQNN